MILNQRSVKKTLEGKRANDSERKSLAARFLKRPNSAQKQKRHAESFYDRAIQLLKNFCEALFCFNVYHNSSLT